MKKYTVSVLTYQRDAMLKRCLESLLKMRVRPGEILIIDQNPTDRLRGEISRYGVRNKDIRFTYVFMGEAHIAKGRKKALEVARYDYLLFTDDDCTVDRDWSYRALLDLENNAPLVAGKCIRNTTNDSAVARALHEQTELFFLMYRDDREKKGKTRSYLMDPKNCAINRNIIMKKGIMYDPRQFWLEDMDFSFQAYEKNIPILFEEKMVVTHTYTHALPQALRAQFKLGYAFETLFRRWKGKPKVRALYLYASRKHMLSRKINRGHDQLLTIFFSLSRNMGYLFGTIRSLIFGT